MVETLVILILAVALGVMWVGLSRKQTEITLLQGDLATRATCTTCDRETQDALEGLTALQAFDQLLPTSKGSTLLPELEHDFERRSIYGHSETFLTYLAAYVLTETLNDRLLWVKCSKIHPNFGGSYWCYTTDLPLVGLSFVLYPTRVLVVVLETEGGERYNIDSESLTKPFQKLSEYLPLHVAGLTLSNLAKLQTYTQETT